MPLNPYLLSSMFAACAAAGSPEMLEAADSSHMHMEGLWNKICSKGKTAAEERYALTSMSRAAVLHASVCWSTPDSLQQVCSARRPLVPVFALWLRHFVALSLLLFAYSTVLDAQMASSGRVQSDCMQDVRCTLM